MRNKPTTVLLLAPLLLLPLPLVASAATISVPLQQRTIQAAIDSAAVGDTIQVSPGTYYENIDFHGKDVKVVAVRGPRQAVIDGKSRGPVVTFASGETRKALLSGFVIQHGLAGFDSACDGDGGGVCISNSAPTVEYNTIKNNGACEGAGVAVEFGSALISGNHIENNTQSGCSGGTGGGGINVGGAASAQIVNNLIENNSMTSANGGGIALFAAGYPTISGNIIRGNSASGITPCAEGGGISMENQSNATIVQNEITGNSASCGGGVYWLVGYGDRGPYLVNNTISDNAGAGVYADGFDARALLVNNILFAGSGQTALYCGDFTSAVPLVQFDDVYAAGGGAYGGTCSDQTGVQGNISADPLFVSSFQHNYHIKKGSPAIDVGSNSAPNIAATDFDGAARIQDGNLTGTATVDMGVDEFTPAQGAAAAASTLAVDGDRPAPRNASARQSQPESLVRHTGQDKLRRAYAFDATGKVAVETDVHGVKRRLK